MKSHLPHTSSRPTNHHPKVHHSRPTHVQVGPAKAKDGEDPSHIKLPAHDGTIESELPLYAEGVFTHTVREPATTRYNRDVLEADCSYSSYL